MKTKILMIALMALPLFMSCSDDDVIEGGKGNENTDDIVEEIPARFYVDWNATWVIIWYLLKRISYIIIRRN